MTEAAATAEAEVAAEAAAEAAADVAAEDGLGGTAAAFARLADEEGEGPHRLDMGCTKRLYKPFYKVPL